MFEFVAGKNSTRPINYSSNSTEVFPRLRCLDSNICTEILDISILFF